MSNGAQPEVAKKGMSPWAWVAIGCGVLLLVGALVAVAVGLFVAKKVGDVASDFKDSPALAAARLVVKANPDLEEVEVDEGAGTITVRQRSSGEVVTLDLDDVKEGRLKLSTDKGEITIQTDKKGGELRVEGSGQEGTFRLRAGSGDATELPDWLPRYPGAEVGNRYSMVHEEGSTGGFQVTTSDPVDVVLEHFRQQLKRAGFEVTVSTFSGDGTLEGGTISATHEANQRNVQVMVTRSDEGTTAAVGFTTGG